MICTENGVFQRMRQRMNLSYHQPHLLVLNQVLNRVLVQVLNQLLRPPLILNLIPLILTPNLLQLHRQNQCLVDQVGLGE